MASGRSPDNDKQDTEPVPNVSLLRAPLTRKNVLSVFDNEFWDNTGIEKVRRSLSSPGERTPDWNKRRKDIKFKWSFSEPDRRPSGWNEWDTQKDAVPDIKDTNHRTNPLTTYRRAPENFRNNFVPEQINAKGRESANRNSNKYASTRVTGKVLRQPVNHEPVNLYGTYRRAPRTLDFREGTKPVQNNAAYQNPAYEDVKEEEESSDQIQPLPTPKPLNNDNVITETPLDAPNQHKHVNKQSSIKHLFSIKLNDLKKNNLQESDKNTNRHKLGRYIENKRRRFVDFLSLRQTHKQPRDTFVKRSKRKLKRLGRSLSGEPSEVHTEPYKFFRLITKYPKASFFIALSGHILIALITVLLLLSGFDLFPTDFEVLPINDYTVPWRKRDLAWRYRDESEDRYIRKFVVQGMEKWPRAMAYGRSNIVLYYDRGDGNVFERSSLKRMEYIENYLSHTEGYKTKYCVMNAKAKCHKPTSILRLFDGTYAFLDPLFNDTNYDNVPEVLYAAMSNNFTRGEIAYFLSKEHDITPTRAYAPVTRSIIPIGYPLRIGEKMDVMEAEMEDYLVSLKPTLESLVKSSSEFKLIYWSYLLFKHDLINQASSDLLLALGSITFIFSFVVYHTKSLWVSSFAVASILTSFLWTNLIYRVVLDYRYFGHFHIIAIFIILGIGADDLFVFLDVWKMTGYKRYPSLAHRLSEAYKTAVMSMFFTSLTTAVAFFASAISPQLAIKSFGVFAGLLVVVNYISVILYFPTVVIMYQVYFKSWSWPCLSYTTNKLQTVISYARGTNSHVEKKNEEQTKTKNTNLFEDNTAIGSAGNVYDVVGEINPSFKNDQDEYGFLPKSKQASGNTKVSHVPPSILVDRKRHNKQRNGDVSNGDITVEIDLRDESDRRNDKSPAPDKAHDPNAKKKILVRFFTGFYFQLITHRVIRWIIIAGLLGVVAFFGYSLSHLETDSEQVQFFRRSHNYGQALYFELHGFVASKADRNVVVYIVWGLGERDMGRCHFSETRCRGVQKYDPQFDPNSQEAQVAIRDFCRMLVNMDDSEIDYYKIRRDFATGQPEIQCFADSLDKFLKAESRSVGINRNLPWDYRKTVTFMQAKSELYTTAPFNTSFAEYLEIAYTLSNVKDVAEWVGDFYNGVYGGTLQTQISMYTAVPFNTYFTKIPISYWLNDGYRFQNMTNFHRYHTLIGEQIGDFSTPLKTDFSVFYGNHITYLGVQVNLTLGRFSTGYSEGRPIMDRWETFVKNQMEQMPKGLQNGFQLTKDFWHTVSLQKSMRDNAIFGIVIGISLAFPILTVATKNVIIGFLATFCMCCSTICVIGMIPLLGWKLGVLESLNMCMVVGLTVDYVVHLAEGYHISKNSERKLRTRDMLEVMGISIFSGACTTLGASLFMFFAQILFFVRFGVFMFCTIGFSLVFSLGLFTTLMGVLGPSGTDGDVKQLFNTACEKAQELRGYISSRKASGKSS